MDIETAKTQLGSMIVERQNQIAVLQTAIDLLNGIYGGKLNELEIAKQTIADLTEEINTLRSQ